MAVSFNPKRSCAEMVTPPSLEGEKICRETLAKLVHALDQGSPANTLDLNELQEIFLPLQEGESGFKKGVPEALNLFLDTLADQQMQVDGPVAFDPDVFEALKSPGIAHLLGQTIDGNEARLKKLQQMQELNKLFNVPLVPLIAPSRERAEPSSLQPEEEMDFLHTFKKWFVQQEKETAWKLPVIDIDFGEKPIVPFFGLTSQAGAMMTPRITVDLALESARTLWNYWDDAYHWSETPSGRFWSSLGSLPILLTKTYAVHEAGHIHRLIETDWLSFFPNSIDSILTFAGGLEATQQASEALMQQPYAGPQGDPLRFILQEDLMFYRRFSEPVAAPILDMQGKGDPTQYLNLRKKINGGVDETWALETVAALETLDPEAIRSLFRWYDYVQTGKVSDKIFKAGYATVAFNGYLAPAGPLLEASGYYYLDSQSVYPSFVKGTLWYSPVEHLGEQTMGAGLELHRFPIPSLDLFGIKLFVGGEFSIWNQATHLPDDEFPSHMLSGALSLYFEKKPLTFSLSGLCKDAGYLPQAPIDAGCYPSASLQVNFGDLARVVGK